MGWVLVVAFSTLMLMAGAAIGFVVGKKASKWCPGCGERPVPFDDRPRMHEIGGSGVRRGH